MNACIVSIFIKFVKNLNSINSMACYQPISVFVHLHSSSDFCLVLFCVDYLEPYMYCSCLNVGCKGSVKRTSIRQDTTTKTAPGAWYALK